MYEDLCAEDEDAAAHTLKVLVPDSFAADTRRKSTRATQARGSEFMEAALMLRKLQAAALAAHGEGAKRALVRLDSCSKSLEHAAIACFDAAMARCEDDTVVGGLASALLDMRAAGDALLSCQAGAAAVRPSCARSAKMTAGTSVALGMLKRAWASRPSGRARRRP